MKDEEEVSVVKQSYKRSMWAAEAVAADLCRSWTAPLGRHLIRHHNETGLCNIQYRACSKCLSPNNCHSSQQHSKA